MSGPGYVANNLGLPILVVVDPGISNTTYKSTTGKNPGQCVQGFLDVKYTLGAGVTSLEIKVEQAISNDVGTDWFPTVLLDTANKTTVNGEFLVPTLALVPSLTSTVTNTKVSIPVPLLNAFIRVSYKITGVGTADVAFYLGRTVLS